ncbi:DNA methyltransferase, partial [Desulfurella sp.]|uniref:Eco57I restriction-modification methylase domain-containing protein n=1 Tax=Desulfurella sp. TaxID=1962857 RepID=UPI0025BC47CF
VDVVLGNPPWLTYKDVKSPYRQKMLDKIYEDYGLSSGSKNKTHQDMAAFFIARSQEYLKDKKNGKIGFVLTRAILDSSQYNSIRSSVFSENSKLPRISRIYDITNKANPFNRSSCIVIFGFKNRSNIIDGFIIDSNINVKGKNLDEVDLEKNIKI